MCICWKQRGALEGKLKETTREGIAWATKRTTWAIKGGAMEGVIKGIVR
jgi:hypothetical protein